MERTKTVVMRIAAAVDALRNSRANANEVWEDAWEEYLETIAKKHLPSGSGIDNGTHIDLEASTPDKLAFHMDYHHMNYLGTYTRWTQHRLQVRPAFSPTGFTVKIRGKNDLNEHLCITLEEALKQEFSDQAHKELLEACKEGR